MDYIKIQFDSRNDETEKNSKCGINSVTHVTEWDWVKTRFFGDMIKNLTSMRYKKGFSLDSFSYDFRRFYSNKWICKKSF